MNLGWKRGVRLTIESRLEKSANQLSGFDLLRNVRLIVESRLRIECQSTVEFRLKDKRNVKLTVKLRLDKTLSFEKLFSL